MFSWVICDWGQRFLRHIIKTKEEFDREQDRNTFFSSLQKSFFCFLISILYIIIFRRKSSEQSKQNKTLSHNTQEEECHSFFYIVYY